MKNSSANLPIHQSKGRKGGLSLPLLIAAGVVAVGAIVYFVSRDGSIPVIKEEVKGLTRDVTTWTDKQIVAHPDLYFRYAIDQFKEKEKALETNRLGITREKAAAAQNLAEHSATEASLTKKLEEAKAAYKAAPTVTDASGKETKKFPIKVGTVTIENKNEFNKQVAIVLSKVEVEKKLAESYKNLETKLENALIKLDSQKTEIELKLATAEGNLKLIETKKTIGEIEKVGADIKNIMINCDILAKETAPGKITLVDAAAIAKNSAVDSAANAAVEAFLNS